jgi:putative tryptophan/tyrosine transport system substrate-binding protein
VCSFNLWTCWGLRIIETAFRAVSDQRAVLIAQLTRILEYVVKNRLPVIYRRPQYVEADGLMSYGVNLTDLDRRAVTYAVTYVDKILKGAKPADLPVEQSTKFEFVINLKTAKQIGLTIPPNVLVQADKVIT